MRQFAVTIVETYDRIHSDPSSRGSGPNKALLVNAETRVEAVRCAKRYIKESNLDVSTVVDALPVVSVPTATTAIHKK